MDLLSSIDWKSGLTLGISLVAAACNGLFGYRLRKLWVSVFGFILGGFLGMLVTGWVTEQAAVIAGVGLLAAIIGALVAYKLYLAGIFCICFLCTASLFLLFLGTDVWWKIVLLVAGGILVGVIGVQFVKPVLIISTSLSAGMTIANSVLEWFHVSENIWYSALGAALAVVFLIFQFKNTKGS